MLQLATILSMVQPWKSNAILRVFLCIDAINENIHRTQKNLNELLAQLRINAKTHMISWENVLSLFNRSSTRNEDIATLPIEQSPSSGTPSMNEFLDINDEYIRGINGLIREQCDNTRCLYLYLPRPPRDRTLSQRYINVLDLLSSHLPATIFVHGVSFVTSTQL